MTPSEIALGQLVRYHETKSRWYFAVVRRFGRPGVELQFFDGTRATVPVADVEPFEIFLDRRDRAWSRTRAQLSEHFYGREIQRLRPARFREMRRALTRAGISIDPQEWPTADTRIRLWRDASFVQSDGGDPELVALLPQWIEPFVLPSGSRDPLGLQAPAERLVNEVLPGLTVFTFRAGYYGFLCWAIRSTNGLASSALPRRMPRREVVNALERALVLCEFIYHGQEDDSCRLLGQRSKLRVLSGNKGDRYAVPESILKNQNSAGSFALFATSLVSVGLVEEADELAANGFLPFRLTQLGGALASAFDRHVDERFMAFALGERTEARDTLRSWGRELCFSRIAHQTRYRELLLRGLLLGNSRDAEKRYNTVHHLYAATLLQNQHDVTELANLTEDDAATLEGDLEGAGVSSLDVVFHFYSRPPREDLGRLQALATFELLSIGLGGLFRAVVATTEQSGKADLAGVTRTISGAGGLAEIWRTPMSQAKPPTARRLVTDLKLAERRDTDPIEAAHIAGALLVRVLRDPLLASTLDVLTQSAHEPMELVQRCLRQRMELSLKQALPELLIAMAERHEVVSERKGRQRWLFVDGAGFARDDPRPMGLGLHALRFPQFGSLARDLRLGEEDLRDA
jgi:hypothetical protein